MPEFHEPTKPLVRRMFPLLPETMLVEMDFKGLEIPDAYASLPVRTSCLPLLPPLPPDAEERP